MIIAEDLPDRDNRVELSSTLTDAAGVPAPRLIYRLDDNTRRLMAWNVERAKESLDAAGAVHLEVVHHAANGHFMGTARMGVDPASSVVDPWCVTHDVPNLLVVDGSVFVTPGSANPTSTIAAVALRAAEHLVERWTSMPVPAHGRSVAFPVAVLPAPAVISARPPTNDERATVRAVADELIPAADGMPGAAEVGVADELLDRVLRARPDLAAPLRQALADLPGDVAGDRRFAPLRYVITAAYYLAEPVRDALGYRPEPATPVRALDYPEFLEEGLLDHLVHR